MLKDYKIWLDLDEIDEDTFKILKNMNNEDIQSSFGSDLEFGTAGLRGELGVGTNKMNIYTVLKSAIAIAQWVIHNNIKNPSVCIGYDVRHMSREFAHIIARVMIHFNIKYYIFEEIVATPQLAYATRFFNSDAGLMVTASHNPKVYNGIKVYKKGGSQILDDDANFIENTSSKLNYNEIFNYLSNEKVEYTEAKLFDKYYDEILSMSLYKDENRKISIVYSPFNGTGLKPMSKVFEKAGYNFIVPEEHSRPDPNFTTIPYPNPEVEKTFEIPKKLALEKSSDIIIATDPDADRMNVCIRHNNEYKFLNGNQVGALMVYWICKRREELGLKKGVIVKTIVTDDFGKKIAESFGYKVVETLTGFKNISRIANMLENTEEKFVMGYEESIGYEIGMLVRDKDGISASLFIADMADYYKKKGKTLIDVLNDLYERFGYYLSNTFSIEFDGINPNDRMSKVMDNIRKKGINNLEIQETIDYLLSDDISLRTNAIIFKLKNAKLAIRPSGTEPKIKIYIYSWLNNYDKSKLISTNIEESVRQFMS